MRRRQGKTPIVVVPLRDKNRACMNSMSFTVETAANEALLLQVEHYIGGPKPDDAPPANAIAGQVWEFVRDVIGSPIYFKLKVNVVNGDHIPICLSFHQPEFPYKLIHAPTARPSDAEDDEDDEE